MSRLTFPIICQHANESVHFSWLIVLANDERSSCLQNNKDLRGSIFAAFNLQVLRGRYFAGDEKIAWRLYIEVVISFLNM